MSAIPPERPIKTVDGNLAHTLAYHTQRQGWGERPLLHLAGASAWTHAQVHDAAARVATWLLGHGVRPGSRVGVALVDSPEFAVTFLGALHCGAVPVLMNPLLTEREHRHMVTEASAKVVVCEPGLVQRFEPATTIAREDLLPAITGLGSAPHAVLPDDAEGYIQFTSGTTGLPKGVVHRQVDPLYYFEAVGCNQFGLGPDDVTLSISKMFFAFGLPCSLLHPLLSGSSAVLVPGRVTTDLVLSAVADFGVTILLGIPTFFAALVDRIADGGSCRSVRLCISGGEPLLPFLAERVETVLGAPVLNHLGATEVGHGFVGQTLAERTPGTTGIALAPYRVEVRGIDGSPAGPGEEGRIWVTGPSLMVGYLNDAAGSGQVLQGGWLRTGDAGVLDARGVLTVLGRDDDVEIVSGYKLWPGEVESVLRQHPLVEQVAVVGGVTGTGATTLCALVVARGPVEDPGEAQEQLRDFARGHLAPFKVPRSVRFITDLPRTATGKLKRYELRRSLHDYLEALEAQP